MPGCYDAEAYAQRCERVKARFKAKIAKLRAAGILVIEGSSLYWRLWTAAGRK